MLCREETYEQCLILWQAVKTSAMSVCCAQVKSYTNPPIPSLSFLYLAGQCHVPHPSGQKPDECCGPHCKSFLRGFDQIPEGLRHGGGQLPRRILEDEGAGKETISQEGKTGGISDSSEERLPEETHFPSTGS